MTDLLPIVFARGQNESVDPRVASPDVHRLAQNVRWRKDGRPSKRYGVAAVTTTGLDSGGTLYTSQSVNAIDSWQGAPLLVLGAGVRQLLGSVWTFATFAAASEISHWAPGERNTVISSESVRLQNPSVAYANGYVLHTWDDGTGVLARIFDSKTGALVFAGGGALVGAITHSRCIGVGNLFYILTKTGTTINVYVIDTTATLSVAIVSNFTATANSNFDVCSRGADWLIVYQTSTILATVSVMSGANPPVAVHTSTAPMATVVGPLFGVAGTTTSSVFVTWLDNGGGGRISSIAWDNALAAVIAGVSVDLDANNVDQPGVCIEDNTHARLVWGGYVAATQTSYMRSTRISDAGAGVVLVTSFGLRAASKPFQGPQYVALGNLDGPYIWAHTHNSDAGNTGTKWDDQRAYLLMRLPSIVPALGPSGVTRQMHVPNVVATANQYTAHLTDSVSTPNGFVTALTNATRLVNTGVTGAVESYAIESVSSRSIRESQRYAARDIALAGRAVQISGGSLWEFEGAAEETGFSNIPVIQSITGSAPGSGFLTPNKTYLYRAVYEWLDIQGRRHRSGPSDPFTFASGVNDTATLVIHPAVSSSRLLGSSMSLHVYRTLANQATYHRVTPNLAPPSGAPGPATVSYVDGMADTSAAGGEFIYTDGGVLDNTLPPPCTFMTVCGARVWLGGQLDRCVVTASKLLVDGEPTQFSDLDVFNVFLPQKCTGLASLDGTVVAFAREKIYLIQGDGPNDQGVGQFSPPQELPTDVGCIDWRSVVETSLGVFFQSKRGIYLLPRGFNTPLFIGAEVQDTLALFPIVVSATLVSVPSNGNGKLGEITVRFVLASTEAGTASAIVTYDLRTQGWSVDYFGAGGPVLGVGGTWSDTFVLPQLNGVTGALLNLFAESSAGYSDNGQFIQTSLGTGDIRPFGVGGYGQFNKVLVMGEYRGNAQVNVQVSVDGAAADTYSFTVTSADGPDGVVYLDVTPKIQKGTSLRVTCTDNADAGTGSAATEGFIMQALFIESELIGKTKRLPVGRKA